VADSKLADRVLVLCFSEFGRRVPENGSAETDHGPKGPVFLAWPAVNSGLLGANSRLTDLDDGDLKPLVDFRQVYAMILDRWHGLASRPALGGTLLRGTRPEFVGSARQKHPKDRWRTAGAIADGRRPLATPPCSRIGVIWRLVESPECEPRISAAPAASRGCPRSEDSRASAVDPKSGTVCVSGAG